jgi:hypothetical protein
MLNGSYIRRYAGNKRKIRISLEIIISVIVPKCKCRAPGNGRARVKGLSPCSRNQAPGGRTLHKTKYPRKVHFLSFKKKGPFRG